MHNEIIRFAIKEGQLVPANSVEEAKYKLFLKLLHEGDTIEAFMNLHKADKTLSQVAYAHVLIRELANYTGHSFEEMKALVKQKTGLYVKTHEGRTTYKSLGDCSKAELSNVIETCLLLGNDIGCYLR